MTGGLNDDFLLENKEENKTTKVTILDEDNFDEVVFDNPTPGEVPEIKENVDLIIIASNRVNDLNYLRQDIDRSGGVNAGFALEAASLIPDFINKDRQLAYFTDHISRTQLNTTLESIDNESTSLFSRIVEYIKKIVNKFIEITKSIIERIRSRYSENELTVYKNISNKEINGALNKLSDVSNNKDNELNTLKSRVKSNFSEIDADEFFNTLEKRFEYIDSAVKQIYQSINSSSLNKSVFFAPDALDFCFTAAKEEKTILEVFKNIFQFAVEIGNGKHSQDVTSGSGNVQSLHVKMFEKTIDRIKIGNTGLKPSEALSYFKSKLDDIEDKVVDPKEYNFHKVVIQFSTLFPVDKISNVINDLDLTHLGSSHDQFNNFHKQLNGFNVRSLTGSVEEINIASKILSKLSKEYNDYFVLRLNYGNLLTTYLNVGRSARALLNRYNKDIFIATATMDEKFQNFVRSHFSDGSPDFFTTPKSSTDNSA